MKVEPERVIAALIAANPKMRLDYGGIAQMYGLGAKYNTMEHKFRAWRKLAETLRVAAGEEGPLTQPQTAPRTPRTPNTRGKKATPASKKATPTAKNKVDKDTKDVKAADTAEAEDVVDISSDDDTPIKVKREVKDETEVTRSLLGIKSHSILHGDIDDEVQLMEEPAAKRVKIEHYSDDLMAQLLSFAPENETRVDSKSNGYELELPSLAMTADEANDQVIQSLDSMLNGAGDAFDAAFGNEEA
ncbi:uncharacterized protein N7496_001946 [Penicillium cataractarum]|uniref:Uncharacterized protein n=1 Tax=Penicillium cataractarum TaxID=2100454 RepID=A0A9W9VWZ7_9EURO|nr:uncharacterized protein N7496_001946 [Penicillium cataractarum]KAJ5390878.1 hypothetical protein N7496_001946 [Penicillium cataractarum]